MRENRNEFVVVPKPYDKQARSEHGKDSGDFDFFIQVQLLGKAESEENTQYMFTSRIIRVNDKNIKIQTHNQIEENAKPKSNNADVYCMLVDTTAENSDTDKKDMLETIKKIRAKKNAAIFVIKDSMNIDQMYKTIAEHCLGKINQHDADYLQKKNLHLSHYSTQTRNTIFRVMFTVLCAIIFTPLSLLISIPLCIKAERKNKIIPVETTARDYQVVRARRTAFMDKTIKDEKSKIKIKKYINKQHDNKPKKVFTAMAPHVAGGNEKIIIYMDRGQYKRHTLFANNDINALDTQAAIGLINGSKEESKQINRAMRVK